MVDCVKYLNIPLTFRISHHRIFRIDFIIKKKYLSENSITADLME